MKKLQKLFPGATSASKRTKTRHKENTCISTCIFFNTWHKVTFLAQKCHIDVFLAGSAVFAACLLQLKATFVLLLGTQIQLTYINYAAEHNLVTVNNWNMIQKWFWGFIVVINVTWCCGVTTSVKQTGRTVAFGFLDDNFFSPSA